MLCTHLKLEWLGRLPHPDLRDANYRLRDHMRLAKPRKIRRKLWSHVSPSLDQGPTPRCVAFSAVTMLLAGPVKQTITPDPQQVYDLAQSLDEWPGANYDGTSVRAGEEALKQLGYINRYLWADTALDVAAYILTKGPCIAGTVWLDSMEDPEPSGYLRVEQGAALTDENAAGHAYCLVGVDLDAKNPDNSTGRIVMQNTWGDWGIDGSGLAYLSFGDLDALIKAGGEVTMPHELLMKG